MDIIWGYDYLHTYTHRSLKFLDQEILLFSFETTGQVKCPETLRKSFDICKFRVTFLLKAKCIRNK